MVLTLPLLASLGALATAQGAGVRALQPAPAAPAVVAVTSGWGGAPLLVPATLSTVTVFDRGATADFTATVRILRGSGRIGAGMAPPMPHMVARAATVAAADGRAVPALIYDFE